MKSVVYSVIAALAAVVSSSAQETSHFAFQVGVGFTEPIGRTGFYTDVGYNTSTGFGYNFNSYFGALIDLNVSSVGVNSPTLNTIGVRGGNVNAFSATLDPIVHLLPHSRVDVYLTGGGGEYRREQIFVAPLSPGNFGGASYFGLSPSNQLVSSSVNKPGVDAGVGIAVGSKWRGKFYAEMKYNKIFLGGPYHMDYENMTFGYRW
jgi:Outer membrane protein beta-barrel domain